MTTPQINMARLVATQSAFAIEADGLLVGYDAEDGERLFMIQHGPIIIAAELEQVTLLAEPPQLAVMTDEATVCVDIPRRIHSALLSLYGGACQ